MRALLFDVFGTVVDWRSSIIAEGRKLGREKKLRVNWPAFADAWRAGYRPAMARVRSGELPWTSIDALHRMILEDLLKQFRVTGLSEQEIDHLNRAWHRLKPWRVLSAELFHHYKPDPETYRGAAQLLGLAEHEVMMVAAHKDDLFAAKSCGLRTAFVPRPLEHGPKGRVDVEPEPAFDIHARDFNELADRLAPGR
jgi:2-haloacid dehalogenase